MFEEAGWTVEDLTKDYGEDLLVRIFENGHTTPLSFFVQSKATDNLPRYFDADSNSFQYPLNTEHLLHWEQFHEPIILTLWDSQSDDTYWTCIQNMSAQFWGVPNLKKRKTVRIPIFCENLLDREGLNRIRNIAQARYRRLECEAEGAKVLIELLQSKRGGEVEYCPQGVVIVNESENQTEVTIFGSMAEALEKIAIVDGISPQQALYVALEKLYKNAKEHEKTGNYLIVNRNTGEMEYRRMSDEQLKRYMMASLEDWDGSG